jgi:hypothetical protein
MSDLRRLAYTTVVGAGFPSTVNSIASPRSYRNALVFEEERQLIARSKLAEAPAPDTDDEATATYLFRKVRATHKRLCGSIDVQELRLIQDSAQSNTLGSWKCRN